MDIPTTKSSVQLDLLHPKFVQRLEAFFADSRIKGRVAVSSGCRSFADQKYYHDRYTSGRSKILAADPNRRFGEKGFDGLGIWRGSWHMQQIDGWCYAVDLHQMNKTLPKPDINRVATEFGCRPTVASEWWHHQPRKSTEWFPAPALTGEPYERHDAPKHKVDWQGIMAAIAAQRAEIIKSPLKRGSKGPAVKTVQTMLGNQGIRVGVADGIFGRKTQTGVRAFQKKRALIRSGTVNVITFDALFK